MTEQEPATVQSMKGTTEHVVLATVQHTVATSLICKVEGIRIRIRKKERKKSKKGKKLMDDDDGSWGVFPCF